MCVRACMCWGGCPKIIGPTAYGPRCLSFYTLLQPFNEKYKEQKSYTEGRKGRTFFDTRSSSKQYCIFQLQWFLFAQSTHPSVGTVGEEEEEREDEDFERIDRCQKRRWRPRNNRTSFLFLLLFWDSPHLILTQRSRPSEGLVKIGLRGRTKERGGL